MQPLVNHFREKFDEQVVPFKEASGLKQYLPKKPKKWGYKLWALAGVSGYIYNFEIDGEIGSGPPVGCTAPNNVGEREFVVLHLM